MNTHLKNVKLTLKDDLFDKNVGGALYAKKVAELKAEQPLGARISSLVPLGAGTRPTGTDTCGSPVPMGAVHAPRRLPAVQY